MIERFDLLEKRGYGFIIGFVDNLTGKHLSDYDMMKLANELSDENEHLKSELEESKKAHSNCDKLWWELHDEKEQLEKENEQLKQQIKIFEKFLEANDLSIDWEEFCGVDECAFENPNFSCKDCIHLKGDVE